MTSFVDEANHNNNNNNNNKNNSVFSNSKLSLDRNVNVNQNDLKNSNAPKIFPIINIYENEELPTKFIIKNIRIKIWRIVFMIIMKVLFFFSPPAKPTKDDKVFYIKK